MTRYSLLCTTLIFSIAGSNISSAQWTRTPSSPTDTVRCLFARGDTIFAGTSSGPFRSTDGGSTWVTASTGFRGIVATMASLGTNIFAGTFHGEIFCSSDAGDHWVPVNVGLPPLHNNITALASIGDTLFAGTGSYAGIYRSTNYGASWAPSNNGLLIKYVQALAVIGMSLFAGTYGGGVFRSTDFANNWTPDSSLLAALAVRCLLPNGGDLFAGAHTVPPDPKAHVFLSTNHGMSWSKISTALNTKIIFTLALSRSSSSTYLLAGTWGDGVFLSTDNGANWRAINTGLKNTDVRALLVVGDHCYAGTEDGGVWKRLLSDLNAPVSVAASHSPRTYVLTQNFPNPFNPGTTIQFSLPHPSHVALKIYNALGECVATLVSQHLQAGEHRRMWDASGIPSGIYFYRLETSDYVETKKLVHLK